MFTRKVLKIHAKEHLRRNYWRMVLASFLYTIALGGGAVSYNFNFSGLSGLSGGASSANSYKLKGPSGFDGFTKTIGMTHISGSLIVGIILAFLLIFAVALCVGLALKIFLLQPAEVGCQRFFLDNHNESSDLKGLGFAFEEGRYKNVVKTQFFKELYLFFWTLLFFIPGIIKSYSYRFVPYILADDPEMATDEVITLSRKLMNGYKWKAFVLDLSFILWEILNVFTFGLLGIFWVEPYRNLTNAEFYLAVRYRIASPQPGNGAPVFTESANRDPFAEAPESEYRSDEDTAGDSANGTDTPTEEKKETVIDTVAVEADDED